MRPRNQRTLVQFDTLERRTLLAAGAPDTAFGTSGKTTADFPGGFLEYSEAAVVQADGKTVVVGRVEKGSIAHFALARFGLDGKLDPSFGPSGNGLVVTPIGNKNSAFAKSVLLLPDGRIVVGGGAKIEERLAFDDFEMTIARYHPSGQLDRSFGGDGVIDNQMFGQAAVTAMALLPDGRILAVGSGYSFTEGLRVNVMRIRTDGSLDRSFGSPVPGTTQRSGEVRISDKPDVYPEAVVIDHTRTPSTNPNFGKALIVGTSEDGGFIYRLRTDGSFDKTFGRNGRLHLLPPAGRTGLTIDDVLMQSDGKALICGSSNGDAVLARIDANGALDLTFGTDGTGFIIFDFGANDDSFTSLISSGSDHFIAAGIRQKQFAAAKFQNNGQLDRSFGSDGKIQPNFGSELFTREAGPLFPRPQVAIAEGPGRRFVMTGGLGFGAARHLDAGANIVTAGTLNPQAAEGGATRSFIVGRLERLPVPTRVFFDIGGTARGPNAAIPLKLDYTLTNMTVPGPFVGPPYVDIPANQTFTTVEITAIDDRRVEGFENATFTIIPDPSYEASHPSSAEFFIADNDGLSIKPAQDATVRGGDFGNTNFGTATSLVVKRHTSPDFLRRAYVEFDISGVSLTPNSVHLRMFGRLNNALERNLPIDVFGTDRAEWSETSITFNNRPAIVGNSLARATILDDVQRWYSWDVTAFVRAERAAGRTKVTFVLNGAVVYNPLAEFVSREGGNFKPELLVDQAL